jgi:hypothetical protein
MVAVAVSPPIFLSGYFGKSNDLIKSGFTITNWNPIVN